MKETPSQTAGPYVHIGLAPGAAGFNIYDNELGGDIFGPDAEGERIRVEGIVLDGADEPVKDVMIEVWQANANGTYAGDGPTEAGLKGWGRVISDFETGAWGLDTIKPGPTGPDHAPHLCLWIVARGINIGLHTRLYFGDEAMNDGDPVLQMVPEDRRTTLIAARDPDQALYRFTIRIQGDNETIFFDI